MTIPSLALILNTNPLDPCEKGGQIFIYTLDSIRRVIKPQKTVVAQSRRRTQKPIKHQRDEVSSCFEKLILPRCLTEL